MTGSATGTDLLLTASDGNRFAAFLATPEHPVSARAVLLPDVNGLRPFSRGMALRFAENPGEPQGFLELHHLGEDVHRTAAADAWERVLSFADRRPAPSPGDR